MRVRQPVYRSGPNSIHQARLQLSHMQGPCKAIVNGTIELDSTDTVIEADGIYYVRSPKFARYYLVARTESGWQTSSKEEKFQSYLINAVQAYIEGQALQQVA